MLTRGLLRLAIVVATLVFSGCSTLSLGPAASDDAPEIVVEAAPASVESKLPPRPIQPPQLSKLPAVAIVLTSKQPAYADVAEELTRRFKNYDVYDLSDNSQPPVTVLRLINDSDSGVVVAIGLRAAQSSVAMAGAPVIFSQVFNYHDHDLLSGTSRGISSLAPLDAQIAAWKETDATISRVGVIVGEGHDDLIAEAELAAQRHGIELLVQIAHSDQETLYLFKRMIRNIDGYWLFPDNRVLSARVLQQLLDEAKRQNVPVAVQNESMLKMGANISFSTVPSDIAAKITEVIRRIQAGDLDRVPALTALSEIRVVINEKLAQKPAVAKSEPQGLARESDR